MKEKDKNNKKPRANSGGSAAASVRTGLKGFAAAITLAAAGLLASGLLLLFTAMGIDSSVGVIMAFITVGAFINGFTAAAAVGRRGLLTGSAAGIIYVGALTAFFALAIGTGAPTPGRAALFAIPVAASAAAGVLGVGRR